MAQVRDCGEALNRPHLCVRKWSADERQAWNMAAVAVHLLNADGAYRTSSDRGFVYMMLKDVRHAA